MWIVRGRMWVKIRFMVKTGKRGAHTGSVTLMIRRDMLGLWKHATCWVREDCRTKGDECCRPSVSCYIYTSCRFHSVISEKMKVGILLLFRGYSIRDRKRYGGAEREALSGVLRGLWRSETCFLFPSSGGTLCQDSWSGGGAGIYASNIVVMAGYWVKEQVI